MVLHGAKETVWVRGGDVLDEAPQLLGRAGLGVVLKPHGADVLDVAVGHGRTEEVAEANLAVGNLDEHAVLGLVFAAAADAVPDLSTRTRVG
eukprot:9528751-Alexandrium_andersonii.AAC.1